MTDEARTRGTAPRGDGTPGDHDGEADRKGAPAQDDSSGVDAIDALNEGARQVLGDAQIDYEAAETYREADEAAIADEAALHGDRITRLPDGTHEVTSVAPGPADDPAGGWADKPVGRKGDSAGDPEHAPDALDPDRRG